MREHAVADEPARGNTPVQPVMPLEVGQATSVGQVRSGNEDSVICEPLGAPTVTQRGLFCAVADGMGGHAAGEVASSMAVQHARDAYYNANVDTVSEALRIAVETANGKVFSAGSAKSGRDQMGSTLTALVVYGDRAIVGHVGDSRCYLIEDGQIRQITRDHSWVAQEVEAGALSPEEARMHPRRNIITRALGLRPEVDVDLYETPIATGSILVLCSDGLHGPVRDDEILDLTRRLPPQRAVDELVSLANQRGGLDNISAVVVRVVDDGDTARRPALMADDRPTPTTLSAVSAADLLEEAVDSTPPRVPIDEPGQALDRPPGVGEPRDGETEPDGEGDSIGGGPRGGLALSLLIAVLVGAALGFLLYFGVFGTP
jgi:serine/threonine protein phosphatase PrpC